MLEGGVKTWTDRVFTLAPESPAWREAGVLPAPYAYGASASLENGLLCIGGCDSKATAATFTCWEFAAEP